MTHDNAVGVAFRYQDKRSVFGWILYDWANSAFALTVMAGFFPVFFKQYWCQGADPAVSTARLGTGNAAAGILIMISAPLIGALADAGKSRKRFLISFMIMGSLMTGLLYTIGMNAWLAALAVFVLANLGFECANLFYDSLLPQIVPEKDMDVISSAGFSMGYLGCALLFLLNILMVSKPSVFGLRDQAHAIRWSFVSASLWWILFSIPMALFVKESAGDKRAKAPEVIRTAVSQLKLTFREIKSTRFLLLFLIAYWLYIDGVHTFIRMAADFGLSIGLPARSLMISLLIVQIVAFPSALLFGFLAKKIGAQKSILAGIGIYIFITVAGSLLVKTILQYTLFAALSGVPLGCLQALSRSYFARMIPAEKSAEYFGFYNIMGKFAVFFGPAMVGAVTLLTRRAGASSFTAARLGMGSISVLFIAGAVILSIADREAKKCLKPNSPD